MSYSNLEEKIQDAENPVTMLRSQEVGSVKFPNVPDEWTNWREEQRAWRESCALADQSYHMTDLLIEGPDAIDLLSQLGVNSFDGFRPGKAKQLVVCSPNGYMIGDGILFYLDEDSLLLVGGPAAPNWVEYHITTGEEDVTCERLGYSRFDQLAGANAHPEHFRFQIQGPDALTVMEEATGGSLPDIAFFHFESVEIAGTTVQALRHGMAGESGFELWGPYSEKEGVRDALLHVGESYEMRQLGRKSYQTTPVIVGWVPLPLPAVYGDDTSDYRQWLDAESYEGIASLGGSYLADDISSYYLRPNEVGYERLISFDHEFIGRKALEQSMSEQHRQLVTLDWKGEDVVDIFASLFREETTSKYMDFPAPRSAAIQYDEVRSENELIGVSKWIGYTFNERKMLSLATIDSQMSTPGTEVTIIWGEKGQPRNRKIGHHRQTEIRATVEPVPYISDRR